MNGSAHFREAEQLLADGSGPAEEALWRAIKANAHATLALVAATVNNDARWVGRSSFRDDEATP